MKIEVQPDAADGARGRAAFVAAGDRAAAAARGLCLLRGPAR